MDFDKTIRLETKVGTLNEKTKCFKDFLKLKLEMLHDEESDNRLLRNNSPKRYAKRAEGIISLKRTERYLCLKNGMEKKQRKRKMKKMPFP